MNRNGILSCQKSIAVFLRLCFYTLIFLQGAGISFGDEPAARTRTEENTGPFYIPMAGYSFISLEKQSAHIPSLGAAIMKGPQDGAFRETPDSWTVAAQYTPYLFSGNMAAGYSFTYHEINFLFEKKKGRHQFIAFAGVGADKPFGSLQTFAAAPGYGYALVHNPTVSLVLGAAPAICDSGFDLHDGSAFPVMLYPLVRFSLNNQYLTANVDVIKGPSLNLTVMPESRIRFTGEFSMNYYRSFEDLNAECALWYRFFDASHSMGDFMGAAIGFKNMGHCFALAERGKFFELQYRSLFACFDLSFLKLKGGYVFDSRTYYDEEKNGSPGKGWFVSVSGMYQF